MGELRPAGRLLRSPSDFAPISPGDAPTNYVAARFVLDVAEGRRPLPLVTETLALAETVRSALIGLHFRRTGHHSRAFTGKDEDGKPLDAHNHAFYLPSDEDQDSRIDQITIYAKGAFSRDDVCALDRLRSLSFGKEGEAEDDGNGKSRRRTTHRLMLVGLDTAKPINGSVFCPSSTWVSATPYIAFRHLKQRGKKRDPRDFIPQEALPEFIKHVFTEDWNQRADLAHLPKPQVEFVTDPHGILGWRYRGLQFRRARNRRGDDGYSRPFGTLRLRFSEAITGPLSLGHASHFGMGLFRAEKAQ